MPRSIATKIAVATLSLTMIVVVLLGTASYVFSRHILRGQIREKLSSEAALLGHRLETRLNSINEDMENMATNLIVVNALIDSSGRAMYIEPFLESYRMHRSIHCLLTLCDFQGKPLVSCEGTHHLRAYSDHALLRRVIDEEQPFARLEKRDSQSALLIAYPVFYGATGRAEGMLVIEVPISPLIAGCIASSQENRGEIVTVSVLDAALWANSEPRPGALVRASIPLVVQPPLDRLAITLSVAEVADRAYSSLNTLPVIYLLIGGGVLVLALLVSHVIARRLTAPLLDLTSVANQVAQNGDKIEPRISVAGNDEIAQLTSSFNTMLTRLRESHDSLEQRVAERTTELLVLNEQLAREVRERTQAEERTHAYAEMQRVLLREVNHRVKNNLVAIISMLHQEEDLAEQAGKLEYVTRLREVVWRVSGLLTVHRLLSSSEWQPLPLSQLCDMVIQDTLKGLPSSRAILPRVTPSDIRVDSDQAHHLAMVLNELATNTMKYALRNRDNAAISVLIGMNNGVIELIYRDDGPGLPEPVLQGDFSGGIGFPLLLGLVTRSLRGTLSLTNDNGAVARITFPAMTEETWTDGGSHDG